MTRYEVYGLDVGVYARSSILPNKISSIVSDGDCVVTEAVSKVFKHRLNKSIVCFINNYNDIKADRKEDAQDKAWTASKERSATTIGNIEEKTIHGGWVPLRSGRLSG